MPYVDLARLGVYKRRHILAFVNAFLKMDEDRSGTRTWTSSWSGSNTTRTRTSRRPSSAVRHGQERRDRVLGVVHRAAQLLPRRGRVLANQLYTTYARSIYGGRQVMKSRDTDDMIKESSGMTKAAKEGTHRSKNPKENLQLARQKLLREGMMYNVEVGVLRKPFVEVCLAHPILISRIKDLGFKIKLCVGGAELWDGIASAKESTMKAMTLAGDDSQLTYDKLVVAVAAECAKRREELVALDKKHRNIEDPTPPRKETTQ